MDINISEIRLNLHKGDFQLVIENLIGAIDYYSKGLTIIESDKVNEFIVYVKKIESCISNGDYLLAVDLLEFELQTLFKTEEEVH